MPQIQVDQRKIHVLYLVKIINAKGSQFHGSVVMTLEKHLYKSSDLDSTPGGDDIYSFFFTKLFFYDNIFFYYLYVLEVNFPLTFPDVTVTAMPVLIVYIYFHFHLVMTFVKLYRKSTNKNMRCPNNMSA